MIWVPANRWGWVVGCGALGEFSSLCYCLPAWITSAIGRESAFRTAPLLEETALIPATRTSSTENECLQMGLVSSTTTGRTWDRNGLQQDFGSKLPK
jgi:hypothetical protein